MKPKASKNKNAKPAEPRSDWEANHSLIRDAMLTLIDRNKGRIPSQEEIAEECGLSRPTVQRHLKEMDLSEIAKSFRALADTVLLGLANKAVRGDAQAAKLYFRLTFGDTSEKASPDSQWLLTAVRSLTLPCCVLILPLASSVI